MRMLAGAGLVPHHRANTSACACVCSQAGLVDLNAAFPDGCFPEKDGPKASREAAAASEAGGAPGTSLPEQQERPERARRGFRWFW